MEAGEAEFHLRLDPECPCDQEIVCATDGVLQECGLADAGLTAKNECPAEPVADGIQQGVECRHLLGSINKAGALCSSDHTGRASARLRRAHGPLQSHRTPKLAARTVQKTRNFRDSIRARDAYRWGNGHG